MLPQVDQAIIAKMQHGLMVNVVRVVMIASFLIMMAGMASGNKTFALTAASCFVVLFIIFYNISVWKPRCSICGGKLHVVNRTVSNEERERLLSSPGTPKHLQAATPLVARHQVNRSIQGFECYHCRKIALLG